MASFYGLFSHYTFTCFTMEPASLYEYNLFIFFTSFQSCLIGDYHLIIFLRRTEPFLIAFPGTPAGLVTSSRRFRHFDVTLSRSLTRSCSRLFLATFLRVFQAKDFAKTGMRTFDPWHRSELIDE